MGLSTEERFVNATIFEDGMRTKIIVIKEICKTSTSYSYIFETHKNFENCEVRGDTWVIWLLFYVSILTNTIQ